MHWKEKLGKYPIPAWLFAIVTVFYCESLLHLWTMETFSAGRFAAVVAFALGFGVLKFIPMTGVTVPFLSYGGTSLVSCLGLMGVVQGVASRNERLLREDQRLAEGGEDAQ